MNPLDPPPTNLPTCALDDLSFAYAAWVLPSHDRVKASRFIVPIPPFDGEELRYPARFPADMRQHDGTLHPNAGQPHPKAGRPLEDWRGQPLRAADGGVPRGVLLFNYEDVAWQGVTSDGEGIVIFNRPSTEQASQLQAWVQERGGPAALNTAAAVIELLEQAKRLGLDDRYPSDRRYAARSLTPVAEVATGIAAYGLHLRANEMVRAVFVPGPARVGTIELGGEGGVFVLIGTANGDALRNIRKVTPTAFTQTYTRADGSPVSIGDLPLEIPSMRRA